jgi:hypothetical protein
LVSPWKVRSYIDGYPFEQGPEMVLMHLIPIRGLGSAIDCTGVALPASLLNISSCLEPLVPLLDFIQGFVVTKVTF